MTLCGFFEGGDHCGALAEKRYLPGWRCPMHTPARVSGNTETTPTPESTAEGMRDRRLRAPDQSRYGRASYDPA